LLNGTPFLNLPLARDSGGQLTGQGNESYSNDVVNRLHLWTDPSGTTTSYLYDNADQLQTASAAGGNHSSFVYDLANQLQSLTVDDSGGNQVAAYSFNYNLNGNRTQMNGLGGGGPPTTTYAYDQANRLVNFNGVATYGYSGDALRMSKTIGGSTTQYTWESIDGLAELLQDGSTSYVTGVGGHPLEQIKPDGTVYYYHQAQVGSTRPSTTTTR
jgi:YD repeat-containing protein